MVNTNVGDDSEDVLMFRDPPADHPVPEDVPEVELEPEEEDHPSDRIALSLEGFAKVQREMRKAESALDEDMREQEALELRFEQAERDVGESVEEFERHLDRMGDAIDEVILGFRAYKDFLREG